MAATRVYFEEGAKSVFAVAVDWPGWARHAKTLDLALAALEEYRNRYEAIVTRGFTAGKLEIIGTVPGSATTDYGAPSESGPLRSSLGARATTSSKYSQDLVRMPT
jgi:hypothetical protein